MTSYYQVCVGYNTHTSGLTLDEAYEMVAHLNNTFPHKQFFISPDYDYEDRIKEEERVYNNNAVDGWEDLFSY